MRGRLVLLVAVVAVCAGGGLAVVPSAFAASASLTRSGETGLTLHFDAGGATFGLKFTVSSGTITGVQSSPNNGCGVSSDATRILCTWTNSTKPTTGDIAFTTNACYPANGGGTLEVDSGSATATGPSDPCGGGTPPPPPPGGSGTPPPTAKPDCEPLRRELERIRIEMEVNRRHLAALKATFQKYDEEKLNPNKNFFYALFHSFGAIELQGQQELALNDEYFRLVAAGVEVKAQLDICEVEASASRRRAQVRTPVAFAAAVPTFGQVWLRPVRKVRHVTCRRPSTRKCNRLADAFRRDVAAQEQRFAAADTVAVALTRQAAARGNGDASGIALQNSVHKIAAGEFATAIEAESRAARALAAQYRQDGISITGSQELSASVLDEARNISGSLLTAFNRSNVPGLTLDDARAAAQTALQGVEPAAFDAVALLQRRPASTSAFKTLHRSITLAEVTAIVAALKKQKAISSSLAKTLNKDLKAAGKSKTARKKNMRKFRDHARKAKATPEKFLRTAAEPLTH